jgi:hypothetical protein
MLRLSAQKSGLFAILLPLNNALSSLIARAFQVHGVDPPRQCATADIHVRIQRDGSRLTTIRTAAVLGNSISQVAELSAKSGSKSLFRCCKSLLCGKKSLFHLAQILA